MIFFPIINIHLLIMFYRVSFYKQKKYFYLFFNKFRLLLVRVKPLDGIYFLLFWGGTLFIFFLFFYLKPPNSKPFI